MLICLWSYSSAMAKSYVNNMSNAVNNPIWAHGEPPSSSSFSASASSSPPPHIAPAKRRKNKGIAVSVAQIAEFFNRKKTFRPRKRFAPGTMRHCLHKRAERSMLAGVDLEAIIKLPPGETLEDWVAVHIVDFFNRINLIFATVYDYCTPNTCPVMNGGPRYEYYWMDGKDYRKPTALPASRYIELVLEWIEVAINDENQFPTSTDVPFPPHFISLAQKIFSRLYRVFVHLFIHHYEVLVYLNAEAPVLTCYRHFFRFITHYQLVSERELSPLASFSAKVCGGNSSGGGDAVLASEKEEEAQTPAPAQSTTTALTANNRSNYITTTNTLNTRPTAAQVFSSFPPLPPQHSQQLQQQQQQRTNRSISSSGSATNNNDRSAGATPNFQIFIAKEKSSNQQVKQRL